MKPPPPSTFWERSISEPNTGCWLWLASLKPNGYGCYRYAQKPLYAHRRAWELTHGEVPAGVQVLHRCDNRACVNPAHLFLGTQLDNMRDMHAKHRNAPSPFKDRGKLLAALAKREPPRGDRHPMRLRPELSRRGEKNPRHKLTEEQVLEILRLRRSGMSVVEIAELFPVNSRSVSNIALGKNWAHLTRG